MPLLSGMVKQGIPDIYKVTSMDTPSQLFNEDEAASLLMPNTVRLLKIYLLAPMSIAAGERTFSVQRRIKTYIRNSMTDKRTNNLMILHIHKDKTDALNLNDITKQFVQANERPMRFFGKY